MIALLLWCLLFLLCWPLALLALVMGASDVPGAVAPLSVSTFQSVMVEATFAQAKNRSQDSIVFSDGLTRSFAPVTFCTSSAVRPGAISSSNKPSGVTRI